MYEPKIGEFDLRLIQTIVTLSVFNAFPKDKNRPLEKAEADKILTTCYYINYLPFACGLLGITVEEYEKIKSISDLQAKIIEIDMSFVFLNILVMHYFSPILLVNS